MYAVGKTCRKAYELAEILVPEPQRGSYKEIRRKFQDQKELIGALEQTLIIYRADFDKERADRERLAERNGTLQEQLEITEILLARHVPETGRGPGARRTEAMRRIREEYYGQRGLSVPAVGAGPIYRSRNAGGVVVCDGRGEERPLEEDEDIIDSLIEPGEGGDTMDCSEAPRADVGKERQDEYRNTLICHTCKKTFPVERHFDFLEHHENCISPPRR